MIETMPKRWLPWGVILSMGGLSLLLALVLHGTSATGHGMSWPATCSLVAVGLTSFLAMRWWQNLLWGFLAGIMLPLHPALRDVAQDNGHLIVALALSFAAVMMILAGYRLLFVTEWYWRSWSVVAVGMIACCTMLWYLDPRLALATCSTVVVAFWFGGILMLPFKHGKIAWGNCLTALLIGLVVPLAGLFLAPPTMKAFGWKANPQINADADHTDLWEQALPTFEELKKPPGFTRVELETWCWPEPWGMLPLALWGIWCALRRGQKSWTRGQIPLAWVLLIYAAMLGGSEMLRGPVLDSSGKIALAGLVFLLAEFGVADFIRTLMDKVRLAPPDERDAV